MDYDTTCLSVSPHTSTVVSVEIRLSVSRRRMRRCAFRLLRLSCGTHLLQARTLEQEQVQQRVARVLQQVDQAVGAAPRVRLVDGGARRRPAARDQFGQLAAVARAAARRRDDLRDAHDVLQVVRELQLEVRVVRLEDPVLDANR